MVTIVVTNVYFPATGGASLSSMNLSVLDTFLLSSAQTKTCQNQQLFYIKYPKMYSIHFWVGDIFERCQNLYFNWAQILKGPASLEIGTQIWKNAWF